MLRSFRTWIEKLIIVVDEVRVKPTPLEGLSLKEVLLLRALVRASFSKLSKQERQILIFRLGLHDGHPKTDSEIVDRLRITPSLIRQAEFSAYRFFPLKFRDSQNE